MRFLVTRPDPHGGRTARRLKGAGAAAVLAPMLEVKPEPAPELALAGIAALAVTSRVAVAMLAGRTDLDRLRQMPVFAVGDATAADARALGFADVRSADGDVDALAALIRAAAPAGRVLHLAGHVRAGDLVARLAEAGIAAAVVVVYRADPVTHLPEAAVADLKAGRIDAGLVYSARTGAALMAAAMASGVADQVRALPLFALSAQAAAPLVAAGAVTVRFPDHPDEAALLALAGVGPVA